MQKRSTADKQIKDTSKSKSDRLNTTYTKQEMRHHAKFKAYIKNIYGANSK